MSDPVALVIADDIALLTLNRPHKLNALNYEMIDRLMAHLDRIEVTPEVRAVILTGAGERAFSAGGDIYEFSKSVSAGVNTAMRDFVRRGQAMTARLEAFPKPVIVAVNGLAFGVAARSPRPSIWRSRATRPSLRSRRSSLACRRPSAERSACHVWPGGSGPWNCF
jgi:enoyl-CoA hydratase/carnithine racemase